MAYPAFIQRSWVLILMMVASFMIPLALEARGLLSMTWELRDGGLFSHAGALVISQTRTFSLVVGATLATVVVAGFHACVARTHEPAGPARPGDPGMAPAASCCRSKRLNH